MPETVSGLVTAVRAMLDEVSARAWTNTNIKRWIYEGMKDMARQTKALRKQADISILANAITVQVTSGATSPATSFLTIRNAWWVPGAPDPRVVELDPMPFDAANQLWGQYPTIGASTPAIFTTKGYPPNLTLQVYPAPSINSTIRVYGAALPTVFNFDENNDTSTLDIFDGWEDPLIDYACMKAMLADRDASPTGWQAYKALYTEKLASCIQNVHSLDINEEFVYGSSSYPVPAWLAHPY